MVERTRNCVCDNVDTKYSEWKDIYSSNQALAVEIQEKNTGICKTLQLRLLRLGGEVRHEKITKLGSGLVEVVAHALSTETFADDVEIETGKEISNLHTLHVKEKSSPVLIDHVRDSKSIVDNLAPSVSVEEFRAQLGSGQVPRGRVSEGGILIDLRQLLTGLEELLQTEEMAIHTVTGASLLGVLGVLGESSAEKLDDFFPGSAVVLVGPAEGDTFIRDSAGGFGTAFSIFAS